MAAFASMKKKKKRKRTPSDGFIQHGIALEDGPISEKGPQMIGDCPFCDKEEKFYVNKDNGSWDCKHCGQRGGPPQFFEKRSKQNEARFQGSKALALSKERGISTKTLRAWRVGWDGQQYTIPVDLCGKTYDLRRFRIGGTFMGTAGGNVSLVGIVDEKSDVIWLCEGEWDAMAMWECLQKLGIGSSVFAVTGGTSFPAHAIPFFENKHVKVAFDKDKTGRSGALRVHTMLSGVAKSLHYVHWPENLPEKFDIRDLYKRRGKQMLQTLNRLFMATPPGAVIESAQEEKSKLDGEGLSRETVIERFREWLYLPNPEVLSVMFGAVLANRMDGDPIWLFFVAPPGGSKTEVLMSLTDAPLILTTTTLTPHALMSGVRNLGNFDPSLIPRLNEKVLVVKDFTTILELPTLQREEIFGVLRDAYDGKTEKYFGNGVHRIYHSRFGILGGVTPIIEKYSVASSMLGERFLKYHLPRSGHMQTGGAIIRAALKNIAKETKMRKALREITHEALNTPITEKDIPNIPDHMITRIMRLSQWVATMRGVVSRERYTNRVEFKPSPEIGTRIAKQLAKLGMGIAMFHRKKQVDEEAYQIVISVARSTAPDRVEEIVKQLYLKGREEFVSVKDVVRWSRFPEGTVRSVLEDLEILRIVQNDGGGFKKKWRLSRALMRLMRPLGLYHREEAWHSAKVRTQEGRRRR